jgi:hypothetical protein
MNRGKGRARKSGHGSETNWCGHPGVLRPRRLQRTTEAINVRLEALRRNALGLRNLANYCWRSLLHSGALHQLVNAL